MARAYECFLGKNPPQRVVEEAERIRESVRSRNPSITDTELDNRTFHLLEENLTARQRRAVMTAQRQGTIWDRVNRYSNPKDQVTALRAMVETYPGGKFTEEVSWEGRREAYKNVIDSFMNDLYNAWSKRVWNVTRSSRGLSGQRNVVREGFGESTGDPFAKDAAGTLRRMNEYVVARMQNLGARVHVDPNRQDVIVQHNSRAVSRATFEEWRDSIVDELDLGRMIDRETGEPFTRESIEPVLREIYDSIRTDGASRINPGQRQYLEFWERMDQSRFFIWKNFEAWERYNQKFGYGDNFFEAIVRHTENSARMLAALETFGPDADATRRMMLDLAKKIEGENRMGNNRSRQTGNAIDKALGYLGGAGNDAFAEGMSSARSIISAGVLGRLSILQGLIEPVTQWKARQFNGLPQWSQTQQLVNAYMGVGTRAARSEILENARRLGLGAESARNAVLHSIRGMGEVDGYRWAHALQDANLRLAGQHVLNDAQRSVFKTEFLSELSRNMGRRFDQFRDKRLAQALQRYGVDEEAWLRMSKSAPTSDVKGTKMLDLASLIREVDPDVGMRISNMITTETNSRAVLTSMEWTRTTLEQGARPGTPLGEAARSATQFLNFPVTMLMGNIAGRWNATEMSRPRRIFMIADLAIWMTVMGGVAEQAYSIVDGRDPEAMDTTDFWQRAAVRGGGLGLASDLLFREYQSGSQALASLIGPVPALAGDVVSAGTGALRAAIDEEEDLTLGRDVSRLFRTVTPFSSLFYLNAAFDRILADRLQMWTDPDAQRYFNRQRRRYLRERDQDYWWEPGEPLPERAPSTRNLERSFEDMMP